MEIHLQPESQPVEIMDWNLLSNFRDLHATREILNSELHYNIFGEGTRYFRIEVVPAGVLDKVFDKGTSKTKLRSRLFDLVLKDKSGKWERVNYHAVQINKGPIKDLKFIHLTDLHIAKRNDEMLSEIVKQKTTALREEIENHFVNFNDMFRRFIQKANNLADEGKLDFVVITGDIVDFAFQGWEDKVNWDENNWKYFVDIVIGRGKERERKISSNDKDDKQKTSTRDKKQKKEIYNHGIKIAVFTSTGNHDWRLYPYDPKSYYKSYRVDKCDLKHFNYKSYDSSEYLGAGRVRVSRAVGLRSWEKLNMKALQYRGVLAKLGTFSARIFVSKALPKILWILPSAGGIGSAIVRGFGSLNSENAPSWSQSEYWWIGIVLGSLVFVFRKSLQSIAYSLADWLVSKLGSLHADATALHYYLANINPYFDYAFQIGRHNFIVMDTGADIFTGSFDPKSQKKIKKMSASDNILGMSPDSRAFDSSRAYYNWSQIVWLEKVLSTLLMSKGRTFVFLHAPPLNLPKKFPNLKLGWLQPAFNRLGRLHRKARRIFQTFIYHISSPLQPWIGEIDPKDFLEENRADSSKHISPDECDLRFGTTKNYLSQFFYLCLGYKEADLPLPKKHRILCRVKMFFWRLLGIDKPEWAKESKQNNHEVKPTIKSVDLVFSGHAHRNIEFRIEKTDTHEIRMYSGWYSKEKEKNKEKSKEKGKEKHRKSLKIPILVQTAACGLAPEKDEKPSPYFRQITVDTNGNITDFTKRNLKEPENTQSDKKNSSVSSVGSQKK
jgi:3',5'-cyclic AMP phosphodiesterase CpdA